jgi:pilus retraction protein PilT
MPSPIINHILDAFGSAATDVFMMEGEAPRLRRDGDFMLLHPAPVPHSAMEELWSACGVNPATHREADISWQIAEGIRLRVNLYQSLGRLAAVMRPIRRVIPSLGELGMPEELLQSWVNRRYGLVLVSGPTGSGKSSTVASCLDWLNHQSGRHIITLEDPIEYLFENDLALFSQREIHRDSESFATGLRTALRQSPDVIFLGEIRDSESAMTALHAAETGHLVISTLHSSSVAETIDRFSNLLKSEFNIGLSLLANQLVGIICQQLLPRPDGGLFPALEYFQNEAVTRRWILEGRTAELQDHLQKNRGGLNCSLLNHLVAATQQGIINADVARSACARPQDFDRAMRGIS